MNTYFGRVGYTICPYNPFGSETLDYKIISNLEIPR